MTRIIEHDQQGPHIVDEDEFEKQGGNIAICQCGLSDNYPFCDGSHQATRDEEDGKLYKYEDDDSEGDRREVSLD